MNEYYYETSSGSKGWFKAETDHKAKERHKFDGVKIWRKDTGGNMTLIVEKKRNNKITRRNRW
ncbi:MAG: hypothetical protein WC341_15370 [Bacteroidales bacterium]|jgi:hypothetical protein